jgi:hypothetical protein
MHDATMWKRCVRRKYLEHNNADAKAVRQASRQLHHRIYDESAVCDNGDLILHPTCDADRDNKCCLVNRSVRTLPPHPCRSRGHASRELISSSSHIICTWDNNTPRHIATPKRGHEWHEQHILSNTCTSQINSIVKTRGAISCAQIHGRICKTADL